MSGNGSQRQGRHDDVVVRKAERGWVVGDENVSDLTSAMVLADLFAADQAVRRRHQPLWKPSTSTARRGARPGRPSAPAPRASDSGAHRLPTVTDAGDVTDRQASPARRSGSRSPLPSSSTRSPPGSGSSRPSACSPSGTGCGPARRSTCCARRRGRAAPGSPSSLRTWWRARRTRCSGCPTSCPARCPSRASAPARCAAAAGTPPALNRGLTRPTEDGGGDGRLAAGVGVERQGQRARQQAFDVPDRSRLAEVVPDGRRVGVDERGARRPAPRRRASR